MTTLPNPFVPEIPADEPSRFVLDEGAFMDAIEQPPVFLSEPSAEFMNAVQIMPIVDVLAGHIR
jgi:hypothetical protein